MTRVTERGHTVIANKTTERGHSVIGDVTERSQRVFGVNNPTYSYHLQMDGIDDYIKCAATFMFDEVILDFLADLKPGVGQYYFDARGGSLGYTYRETNNADRYSGFASVSVDGVVKSYGTPYIPSNQRVVYRMWGAIPASDDINIFSNSSPGRPGQFVKGDIYSIIFKHNGVITAHYDMSTGTLLDQSGNGNHGTLIGGTWVADSVVVSQSFATQQVITAPTSDRYIQLDGINDFLQLPYALPASAIELDVWIRQEHDGVPRYLFDARYGDWVYAMISYNFNYDITNAEMYIDGEWVEAPYSTPVDTTRRVRIKFTINSRYLEDDLTFFAANEEYQGQNLKVDVYGIKLYYFDDEPFAHFDFTTGTLDDQSGNGYVIEMSGGTWIGNDTPDDGTEVSTLYYIRQMVSANKGIDTASRQTMFANHVMDNTSRQVQIANRSVGIASRQTIFANRAVDNTSRQVLIANKTAQGTIQQNAYTTRSIQGIMHQNTYTNRTTTTSVKTIVNNIVTRSYSLRSIISHIRTVDLPTLLKRVATSTFGMTIKQSIHNEVTSTHTSKQEVYTNTTDASSFKIVMINGDKLIVGRITLRGRRILRNILKGTQVLRVKLKGGIDVTVDKQDINLVAGDSRYLDIQIEDIADLTGVTATLTAKKSEYSNTFDIHKDTSNGITIDVENNILIVLLSPEDTIDLKNAYQYQVRIVDIAGNASTVTTGVLNVRPSNTKDL